MNLLRTAMVTFLFSIATISNAGSFEINDAQVTSIQTYTNGTIGVVTNKQTKGPVPCSSSSKFIIPSTDVGANNAQSVLLTAKVSSSLVNIYIDALLSHN